MTIATRTKLVAYEDSLSGSDPFEDGSYTSVGETAKTPTEKMSTTNKKSLSRKRNVMLIYSHRLKKQKSR